MDYQTWLFDGDGVLYVDGKVQPDAPDFIRTLRSFKLNYALVSNNSTKTLNQYLMMLQSMNLPFRKEQIFTSAYVSPRFLKGESVYIIGEEGIFDACSEAGFKIKNSTPNEPVDNVIVGMDRNFNYTKMTYAMRHIMNGSHFVGTNPDVNFPARDGFTPGAGTMIAALETASERKVNIIVGKPQKYLFETALKGTPKENTIMVGDRFETDILGAHNFGIDTVLVRTGIGSRYSSQQIEQFRKEFGCPRYVVNNLNELRKEFIS